LLDIRVLCSIVVLAVCGFQASGQIPAKTFTNPVTVSGKPIHMGDPWAFRANEAYFLVGTTSEHEEFKVYTSRNLAYWKLLGWVLKGQPGFGARDLFWAPEVHAYRGRYYMVYSGMLSSEPVPKLLLGLAVSDKPQGPYTSLHTPWFDPGYSAIDGDIFIDADGMPYLFFSRNGGHSYASGEVYGVALAVDLSMPIGTPKLMIKASQPWELQHPGVNQCNEGPTVFRHGGLYYMTYSANDTANPDYGIGYATAHAPLGPWTKSEANPILRTLPGTGISGPGHDSTVASPNGRELWIVYHTHADPARPSEDRIVNADRITFGPDGSMHVFPTRSPQPFPAGVP